VKTKNINHNDNKTTTVIVQKRDYHKLIMCRYAENYGLKI